MDYPYVYEGVQGKGPPVDLPHDLPEKLHYDKDEHQVAYYVRDGVLCVEDKIRDALDHKKGGHAYYAQGDKEEYYVVYDIQEPV
ncbi:MAG: hypothetical protein HY889_06850 [Deltaproteobacteria bacterium]|nr:hypothetical protein [Deltaproteobacteria bacterium]